MNARPSATFGATFVLPFYAVEFFQHGFRDGATCYHAPQMDQLTEWGVITVVGSLVGSFLGAYLKRKGENLATHEDIDDLVHQVSAVTTATKEIEAKISHNVWDRQKRWEMKQQVLFDTAKSVQELQDSLLNLHAAYEVAAERKEKGEDVPPQLQGDAGTIWIASMSKFDTSGLLVEVVCGPEVLSACKELGALGKRIARKIHLGDTKAYTSSIGDVTKKAQAVTNAIRKELVEASSEKSDD